MKNSLKPIKGVSAFREFIRRSADGAPSYAAYAKDHGISPSQLSQLMGGYGCIGEAMAAKFGYDLVPGEPMFVPIERTK